MPQNGTTCLKNKITSVAWFLFLKRTFNFGFDFYKKIESSLCVNLSLVLSILKSYNFVFNTFFKFKNL